MRYTINYIATGIKFSSIPYTDATMFISPTEGFRVDINGNSTHFLNPTLVEDLTGIQIASVISGTNYFQNSEVGTSVMIPISELDRSSPYLSNSTICYDSSGSIGVYIENNGDMSIWKIMSKISKPLDATQFAKRTELESHISDDIVRWQQYLDTDAKLQRLEIQMKRILDGTTNVVLDSTTTDIESDSVTGFTVTNALGGQIVATAGTYLLVGTGRVWINDVLVFDNAGVSVGIGSKSYVQDVKNGDVIRSEALTSLTYTNYIAKI